MFIFKKREPARTLSDLETYLLLNGGEPIKLLAREIDSWGEISYAELEALIESGGLNDFLSWQEKYASVVNEILSPAWASAMAAAALKSSKGKIILSDSDWDVNHWLQSHGAQFITNCSDESKKAIANILLRWQADELNPKKMAQQIRPLIGLTSRQMIAVENYRAEAGDRAALRYASHQHRFRAETIVHTELAFAYNQGAHMGVTRSIRQGYMNRCAMIWSTAGTNRVCGRCLELKDKVIGYTDEEVQLPPLHPRCRCAIIYREVGGAAIRNKLEAAKNELQIKGELVYPPPRLDLSQYLFDAAHTQGDKHPHDVTEAQARKFVNEAYFTLVRYNGDSYNYYGKTGAAFVRTDLKTIRTAFKAEEYDDKIRKMIEVYENARRES